MTERRKWVWVAVSTAVLLALASLADGRGFRRYLKLQREVEGLSDRNRSLSEQNRALLQEVESLRKDPRALERVAREELGFIKPGEMVILLE